MLGKISGLARLVNILIAVIAGLVHIPGLDVVTILIVLGLIAGLSYGNTSGVTSLLIPAIALPVVASVLDQLPAIGTQLGSITSNLAIGVAGSAASAMAILMVGMVKKDACGLMSK